MDIGLDIMKRNGGPAVHRVLAATLLLAIPAALARPLGGQPVDTLPQGAGERLFNRNDAYLALGFSAITIAMFPIDRSAALRLQRDRVQNRRLYNRGATFFRILGAPTSFITAAGMYGAGRLSGQRRLADFGLHVSESIVLAGAITYAGKGLAGRARPRHFRDTLGLRPFEPNPRDFQFGRGFEGGEFQAFPSGHTSAAFAFASALASEVHRWKPNATWWVGPILYGGATLVGASRMYNNAHWASDVALGAAIGTFAGLKVVKFNHHRSANRINRFFLGANISTGGQGATQISLTLTPGKGARIE